MNHLRWLFAFAVLAVFLLAPVQAEPSDAYRERAYQQAIDALPATQNSDGGFGPLTVITDSDGNTTNITTPVHESFLQTVLTVHLLILEKSDRLDTYENWEGEQTSLARSNTTSARDWLQQYERNHEARLTPGDYALLALAYSDLGDNENARQLMIRLLDDESKGDSRFGAMDAARLIFAQNHIQVELNETQNATYNELDTRLMNMQLSAPEPLAWALLAQPDHGDRRVDMAKNLHDHTRLSYLTLGAWALATSGGNDIPTQDTLLLAYQSGAQNDEGAFIHYLLAERTAKPHFSAHIPLVEGGATIGTGSEAGGSGNSVAQVEPDEPSGAAPPTGQEPPVAGEGRAAFPLPAWLMMATILFALGVVLVTGLAYGLKREDLNGPRKNIFDYIESHPGEHFSKIRRDLNLAPGTFQHHLSVLESGGWITSYKDARYKRYFVNGNRYKQMIAGYQYKQKFAALANGTTRDLVQFIQQHPGVTQKEVAIRLNLHASTVNWHANRLKQAGILNPERVGREVRYHVDQDVVQKMMQHANN